MLQVCNVEKLYNHMSNYSLNLYALAYPSVATCSKSLASMLIEHHIAWLSQSLPPGFVRCYLC